MSAKRGKWSWIAFGLLFGLAPMIAGHFGGSLTSPIAAEAAETPTYNDAAFAAAQEAGKPILVDIHASWCPVCAAQKPTIDKLTQSAEFKDLAFFTVDFDTQKDVVRKFGAEYQSTLIVFNGKTEKGRSVGVTDPDQIHDLLKQSKQP